MRSTDGAHQWRCCSLWQRKLSNKLNAKEFAERYGVPVARLYWEGLDPRAIPFATFPSRYVIKTSNGAASQEVIPVCAGWDVLRNKPAPPSQVRRFYEHLLSRPEFRGTPLLVEEFIEPAMGEVLPRDYKLYCFGGEVRYIEVINRPARRDAWYTPSWERVPDRMQLHFDPDLSIGKPALLDVLLNAARKLSRAYEYPFVRLDFYLTSDDVVFGEFTHTPFAGKSVDRFTPTGDRVLGYLWQEALECVSSSGANEVSQEAR